MVNGPLIDPNADNTKKVNAQANAAVGQALQNGANQIGNFLGTSLGSMFGITPARAGKAIHQVLVGSAGVLIIILGFILIVSGSKTGQVIANGVKGAVTKTAEVAAIA